MGCHTSVFRTKLPVTKKARVIAVNEKKSSTSFIKKSLTFLEKCKHNYKIRFLLIDLINSYHSDLETSLTELFDYDKVDEIMEAYKLKEIEVLYLIQFYRNLYLTKPLNDLKDFWLFIENYIEEARKSLMEYPEELNLDISMEKVYEDKNIKLNCYPSHKSRKYVLVDEVSHDPFRVYGYPEEEFDNAKDLLNWLLDPEVKNQRGLYTSENFEFISFQENPVEFEKEITKLVKDLYEKYPGCVVNFG